MTLTKIRVKQIQYLIVCFGPIVTLSYLLSMQKFNLDNSFYILGYILAIYICIRVASSIVKVSKFPLWSKFATKDEIDFINKNINKIKTNKIDELINDKSVLYAFHYYYIKKRVDFIKENYES